MTAYLHERLRALRTAEQRVQPDEAWVRATRETLLMQAKNSLPAEKLSLIQQAGHVVGWFAPKRIAQVMRGPVMATLSIFVVAFGGSVASVSAAERSLPGDFLYSLKLATEQARLALTSTKGDKLKLKIEFTSRRADELTQVAKSEDVSSRPQRVEQTAEILKRDLDTVKQQLDDVKHTGSPQEVVDAAKLVDHTSNTLVQQLQDSKADLTDATKDKVTQAQAAAADTGVKAIEVIVEKHKESEAVVSASDVVEALQDHAQTVADAMGSLVPMTTSTMVLAAVSGTSTVSLDKAVQEMKTATIQAFASSTDAISNDFAIGGTSGTTVLIGGTSSSASSTGSTTSTTPTTTNSSTKPSS